MEDYSVRRRCSKCKLEKLFDNFYRLLGCTTYSSWCKSCTQVYRSTSRSIFNRIKNQAKSRDLKFGLTEGQVGQLMAESCFISNCSKKVTGLDRVDNSEGYTIDNVRPSCLDHNKIKLDRSDQETYNLCKTFTQWYECQWASIGDPFDPL